MGKADGSRGEAAITAKFADLLLRDIQ